MNQIYIKVYFVEIQTQKGCLQWIKVINLCVAKRNFYKFLAQLILPLWIQTWAKDQLSHFPWSWSDLELIFRSAWSMLVNTGPGVIPSKCFVLDLMQKSKKKTFTIDHEMFSTNLTVSTSSRNTSCITVVCWVSSMLIVNFITNRLCGKSPMVTSFLA